MDSAAATLYKGCRIVDNPDDGSLRLSLNDFPDAPTRRFLLGHGFDWSEVNQCWWCNRSGKAIVHARKAIDIMTRGD
jgi:hypothetical protein